MDAQQEDATDNKPQEVVPSGELLFCGSTNWETIGRKQVSDGGASSLPTPTRLHALLGISISFVASGSGVCDRGTFLELFQMAAFLALSSSVCEKLSRV